MSLTPVRLLASSWRSPAVSARCARSDIIVLEEVRSAVCPVLHGEIDRMPRAPRRRPTATLDSSPVSKHVQPFGLFKHTSHTARLCARRGNRAVAQVRP